ncbi:MAG: hypothetical protein ACLFVH_08385 [Phycisphaerae bacterium]
MTRHNRRMGWRGALASLALVVGMMPLVATAAEGGNWLNAMAEEQGTVQQVESGKPEMAVPAEGPAKAIPGLGLAVDYAMVSDYIWRGQNFSEWSGEGREALNHQVGFTVSVDTSEALGMNLGTFSGNVWFEFYADQDNARRMGPADRNQDCTLQEVDYTIDWTYGVTEFMDVSVGHIWYHFPQSEGDDRMTNEWYVGLSFDDTELWKMCGIDFNLNPTIAYYIDVDNADYGQWIIAGLSHEFVMSEMGMQDVPVLKDTTLTPSVQFHFDHRYLNTNRTTKLSSINYQLDIAVDLSSALEIPAEWGGFSVGGFLAYSQAVDDGAAAGISDEFYGGMNVGWEW